MELTRADRESILAEFRRLTEDSADADENIWQSIGAWAATLDPRFVFVQALVRDIVYLCDYARRYAHDSAVGRFAHGALRYLHKMNIESPPAQGLLGLFDDAFVCGFAVHSIRSVLGDRARYTLPRLADAERSRAESLFLELAVAPAQGDASLIEEADRVLRSLGSMVESGIFARLDRNCRFLMTVLADPSRPAEHHQYARGAIHYLVQEEDAIPDSMGVIGFLDDYFISELAVGFVCPDRTPWSDLIDEVVASWPFLNMAAIADESGSAPLSEFMRINAALICPSVGDPDGPSLTYLVVPVVGPTPLLLGFFAALGNICEQRKSGESGFAFFPGQRVKVDQDAIRIFEGFTEDGTTFRLLRERIQRGEIVHDVDELPVSQLYRLVPENHARKTAGKIAPSTNEKIGPLDWLFTSEHSIVGLGPREQVVLVAAIQETRNFAETISVCGKPLIDVLPIAHRKADGAWERWSTRFGVARPQVVVVADADHACEFVEGEESMPTLVIIDSTGRNAGRAAAVARLVSLGCRVLAITTQSQADGIDADGGSAVWEWGKDDANSLLWFQDNAVPQGVGVRQYEHRVRTSLLSDVDVRVLECAAARDAHDALRHIDAAIKQRGEAIPLELEDAQGVAYGVLLKLLRCPVPLQDQPRAIERLEAELTRIVQPSQRFVLSPEEQQLLKEAEQRLRDLASELLESNSKYEEIQTICHAAPGTVVLTTDLESFDATSGIMMRPLHDAQEAGALGPAILPGWLGRGRMTRFLRPPIASPLVLLLYDVEQDWYRGFQQHAAKAAAGRAKRSRRNRFFPHVAGWPEPRESPADANGNAGSDSDRPEQTADTQWFERHRRRLLGQASDGREPTELARLFMFEGGSSAFLTDDFTAHVATHLLQEAVGDDADMDLVRKPAADLQVGDAVLFLRGSDRDVIRVQADTHFLKPGTRDVASLWKIALRTFAASQGLGPRQVWERLHAAGCPLGPQAIQTWLTRDGLIAPLDYERDIGNVATVTADPKLNARLKECLDAVAAVRSAHLKASFRLAKEVRKAAIRELSSHGGLASLSDDVVIARVRLIDATPVPVRTTLVNRLREDVSWLA